MKDVLFYQNYTPVADVCTIAICMIHWMLLRSTYTVKQKNLTLFRCANFAVLIAAVANIAFHEVIQNLSYENVLFAYITRDVVYIALLLTYVMFGVYIRNLAYMSRARKKRFNTLLWGGFVVFCIWEVTSPYTGFGFRIDEQLQIHQNFYSDVFRFAYSYDALLIAMLLLVNRRKFITKVWHCICRVMLISVLVMALEYTLVTTSYTCISFTFPIMAALFLFHYNAYDVETGTLDSKAFNAYIKDMGNKKFSMICLSLENMSADKLKELPEELFHFNEKFFHASCTFRLREDKMAVIYRDDKNRQAENKTDKLTEEFKQLYDIYKMDYRLVFIHSQEELKLGSDYLALDDFLEERMQVNTMYHCKQEDVEKFLKTSYILSQLRDIHIRQDIDDARVKAYCQPVLNTATNTFTSAEALMRLELPECGMVYPNDFIPLAEKHGYIHTLSKIILNKTCRQIRRIESDGYQIDRISVNFSITELKDENFCDDVTQIIHQNAIPYEKIAIELTESRNEKDFETVQNIMGNLHGLGVKFYLDDFGTGYSNFERIIGLPIDIIKFDRSLTILAGKDAESRFLVGSFSDIFKKSNYQILFEGVEDDRDENQCKEMNALYLQGYKYSRPIPLEELERFLKRVG